MALTGDCFYFHESGTAIIAEGTSSERGEGLERVAFPLPSLKARRRGSEVHSPVGSSNAIEKEKSKGKLTERDFFSTSYPAKAGDVLEGSL